MPDEDDGLTGTTDTVKPWTIKAIATGARDQAIAAARADGVNVGQWLERRIQDWAADGGTAGPATRLAPPQTQVADLAEMVRLAIELAEIDPAKDPLLRNARGTVRAVLLALRPVTARKSRPRLPDDSIPSAQRKRLAN